MSYQPVQNVIGCSKCRSSANLAVIGSIFTRKQRRRPSWWTQAVIGSWAACDRSWLVEWGFIWNVRKMAAVWSCDPENMFLWIIVMFWTEYLDPGGSSGPWWTFWTLVDLSNRTRLFLLEIYWSVDHRDVIGELPHCCCCSLSLLLSSYLEVIVSVVSGES